MRSTHKSTTCQSTNRAAIGRLRSFLRNLPIAALMSALLLAVLLALPGSAMGQLQGYRAGAPVTFENGGTVSGTYQYLDISAYIAQSQLAFSGTMKEDKRWWQYIVPSGLSVGSDIWGVSVGLNWDFSPPSSYKFSGTGTISTLTNGSLTNTGTVEKAVTLPRTASFDCVIFGRY